MNAEAPVLVVEDDPDIRDLLATRLEDLGCRVVGVGTGEAALVAARAEAPRLIVLDVVLPGIDGWEVARRLGDDPATAAVPIVVVSMLDPGRSDDAVGDRIRGRLVKPFRAHEVAALVTGVLATSKEENP